MRFRSFIAVAVILLAPTQGLGQIRVPTNTDLAAAYCVGVLNRTEQVATNALCPDPVANGNHGATEVCRQERADQADQRRRLVGYLLARGYLTGNRANDAYGVLISINGGDSDVSSCRVELEARCDHCFGGLPGGSVPLGSADQVLACLNTCRTAIPSCARAARCADGTFLGGVP